MAQTDRFMIAPMKSGIRSDLKPWIIPDDAFAQLTNAYVFRGRVRKRFGSRPLQGSVTPTIGFEQLQARLRIKLGTTDGAGAFTGFVPRAGNIPLATPAIGQMFSIGNQIFNVYQLGVAANLLFTGAIVTATYDTTSGNATSGQVIFAAAAVLTDVYFYPALPVMGFSSYNATPRVLGNEVLFAFDTRFAYQFTASGWERLGTEDWSGTNTNFFWSTSWIGDEFNDNYLFVTNNKVGNTVASTDQMNYWDGAAWNTFAPGFDATDANNIIISARIIIPFHKTLVLLNTTETNAALDVLNYPNRARFSWVGSPVNTGGVNTAFYENGNGQGGVQDAPTTEAIVTAQFVKDRLIVFFEASTWELVFTGNYLQPFLWQQINTELGADSTFSEVPFDKVVLGIGNVGIHACNGANVERIDNDIPDEVFDFHNANGGRSRVFGIRDYFVEMVYWSFPSVFRTDAVPYNNRVLVYNYKTGAWAFNEDSITAFGYHKESAGQDDTWIADHGIWQTDINSWDNGTSVQSGFQSVVAGNQEGFVFVVDPDLGRNSQSLQITNITYNPATFLATVVCIDHNLIPGVGGINAVGDYVIIENAQGVTGINGVIYPVNSIIDQNSFTLFIDPLDFVGTYTGGGTLALVSNIDILTKQYNFYVQDGRNAVISKVDFCLEKTSDGEITVDTFISSSEESQIEAATLNGSLVGTGVLETSAYALSALEQTQNRIWHPIYPMAEGECIQLRLYMNEDQLRNPNISWSDFQLHAMTFYASPTSRLQ